MAARHERHPRPEPVARSSPRHRRRRRRRTRGLGVPAPVVFYSVGAVAAVGAGLTYMRGGLFVIFSVIAALLILAALLINERAGFYQSRRARRPSEARDKFTMLEVAVLFVLLLLSIFLTVNELATG